jgi:hypothetical protein
MTTLILILALAAPQDSSFTAEDIRKLAKAGIGDEVILAKIEQEKGSLKLTADDLADLKKSGISEKVLTRLAELSKRAGAPRGPKSVALKNLSHRGVRVSLRESDRLINFSMSEGADLPSGGSLDLAAPPGDYAIAIEGRPTTEGVRVTDGETCLLTVRGADTAYIDLQTIVAEDREGRRVVILHSQGRAAPGQGRHGTTEYTGAHVGFCGPEMSYFPFVSRNVLLGAGVGAIIGHQSGHRTRGAIIGAGAGLLLDSMMWR